MPLGVDHDNNVVITSLLWIVPLPLMPLGVDHTYREAGALLDA